MDTKDKVVKEEVKPEVKAPEFSEGELMAVFDQILFEGEFKEEITIRGKLKVTFKSMSAKDISEISKELDNKSYNLVSTFQEQRSLLTLSKGLVGYQNRDLGAMTDEAKAAFIDKLPASVIASISDAQFKFNRKVDAACKEGETNF